MRSLLKKVKIGKNELIADSIFLFVSMAISGIAIYIFDIHWSFYPGNTIFPPNKYIFSTLIPYYVGIPAGGIIGFFLIKLFCFALIKEEEDIVVDIVKREEKNLTRNGRNKSKKRG